MHPESIDSGTCRPSNRHRPSGENKLAKNTFVKIKKRKQTPNETDKVNLGSYSVHLNPPQKYVQVLHSSLESLFKFRCYGFMYKFDSTQCNNIADKILYC